MRGDGVIAGVNVKVDVGVRVDVGVAVPVGFAVGDNVSVNTGALDVAEAATWVDVGVDVFETVIGKIGRLGKNR